MKHVVKKKFKLKIKVLNLYLLPGRNGYEFMFPEFKSPYF
jgi:hypothetical protein